VFEQNFRVWYGPFVERATRLSFHNRWSPPLIKSFMMSYDGATLLKTWPTNVCFSCTGTSRKPAKVWKRHINRRLPHKSSSQRGAQRCNTEKQSWNCKEASLLQQNRTKINTVARACALAIILAVCSPSGCRSERSHATYLPPRTQHRQRHSMPQHHHLTLEKNYTPKTTTTNDNRIRKLQRPKFKRRQNKKRCPSTP
jgi:hypothetical protein